MFSVMLFLLGLTVTASAAVTYDLGESSDSITVKYDADASGSFMYLLKPDMEMADLELSMDEGTPDNSLEYFEQIKDENVPFSREILMKADAVPGKYKLFLGDESISVWYAPYQYRMDTCVQIGLADESYNSLMTQNIYYFCKDPDRLGDSSNIAKVVDTVKAKIVPGTLGADADSCKTLTKYIEESILYVNTVKGQKLTKEELIQILDSSFEDKIEELITKMTDTGVENVINQLAAANPVSYAEFEKKVEECMVLNAIAYPKLFGGEAVAELLRNYKGYIGLDLTLFESFSESRQITVAQAISNAKPTSVAQIEEIIEKNKPQNNTSSGGGGGGGGGGIATKPATPVGSDNQEESKENDTPDTPPEQNENPQETIVVFSDMSGYEWAKDAVEYMSENGFVKGVSENEFAPSKNITRAEFAAIIVRCMKYDTQTDAENVFSDVSKDFWGYESIMTAYNEGIVSGSGDAVFNPQGNITRQDMAVILYNVYKKNNEALPEGDSSFEDFNEVADYAKDAVSVLHGAEILNGSDNSYNPKGLCTRAEAVQAIYGFLKAVAVTE